MVRLKATRPLHRTACIIGAVRRTQRLGEQHERVNVGRVALEMRGEHADRFLRPVTRAMQPSELEPGFAKSRSHRERRHEFKPSREMIAGGLQKARNRHARRGPRGIERQRAPIQNDGQRRFTHERRGVTNKMKQRGAARIELQEPVDGRACHTCPV